MSRKFYDRLLSGSGVQSKPFKSSFGEVMLKKMGWKEGNGLGREQQGTTSCLQIKKREQALGLGADSKDAPEEQWKNWWGDLYNNIANKIQTHHTTHDSDDDSEADETAHSPSTKKHRRHSDELLAACKGRTCRKADRMAGKLQRIQAQDAASNHHPSQPHRATPSFAHKVPAKKANKKRKATHLQLLEEHHDHTSEHADGHGHDIATGSPLPSASKKAKKKQKAGRVTEIDGGSNTEEARSPERAGWHGSFPAAAAATSAAAAADGAKKAKKKGRKAKKGAE
ncbi:unnamed protein product [Vitrella brassicaformis CCMP3155]|uniref:G-patch domain-containing protein n=1 Tax=Vitrella brassicaformis (strain CCMP3155) TaxID=1169540 RepID=A0A0G4EFG4_VITBC|nr:unnamed protein product [Vitrella brassicaformis CCMP3155]|eukprot:CEL94736.1 unnamed protein product [Vitrella brassicaformis CCMP3155]